MDVVKIFEANGLYSPVGSGGGGTEDCCAATNNEVGADFVGDNELISDEF